jgi:hypothetical protein
MESTEAWVNLLISHGTGTTSILGKFSPAWDKNFFQMVVHSDDSTGMTHNKEYCFVIKPIKNQVS